MTDKPDGGAAQMTGPDKIWASPQEYIGLDNIPVQIWHDYQTARDGYETEYTRTDLCRTAAHPVTLEKLERWETTATAYPWISEAEFLTEIRADIATMKAMK